ncbi:Sec-independent protein translocase protein TatCy [subsurface metagenome]
MAKKQDKDNMSFLEHLEELRWHLVRSFLAIVVIAILAFIFRDIVFDRIILAPKTPEFFTNRNFCSFSKLVNVPALCINSKPFQIININMAGQFTTHIMVSLIAGIIVAFPYIFFEFWSFLKPALYKKEKSHTSGAVFFSSLLFLLGVLFGYYIITPLSVHFLGSYKVSEQVLNQINLISYISTVASVTLASGIIFELPILVYFLTKIGLLSPEFLKKYRKHSIIVILALSAIITPPDIFSQVLVCFPLLILYEIGIMISKRIIAQEKAKLEED